MNIDSEITIVTIIFKSVFFLYLFLFLNMYPDISGCKLLGKMENIVFKTFNKAFTFISCCIGVTAFA